MKWKQIVISLGFFHQTVISHDELLKEWVLSDEGFVEEFETCSVK